MLAYSTSALWKERERERKRERERERERERKREREKRGLKKNYYLKILDQSNF
jgi:hypothetical protein